MAKQETKLDILVGVQGTEKLRGLTSSLRGLSKGTVNAGTNTKKLVNNLKSFEATNVKSINNTRALANSYRNLAKNVKFNSNRFKEATREANRLEKELRKMQATANKGMGKKGRLGNLAKSAGAIGAAGIFGGPEGPSGVIKSNELLELFNKRSIDLYASAPFSLLEPLIIFQPQFVAIWDIKSASL